MIKKAKQSCKIMGYETKQKKDRSFLSSVPKVCTERKHHRKQVSEKVGLGSSYSKGTQRKLYGSEETTTPSADISASIDLTNMLSSLSLKL